MKLMILVIPKDQTEQISKVIGNLKIDFQTVIPATGTASTEILEYLSLVDIEKDLLFSLVDDADIESIYTTLKNDLDFLASGHGIAFTVDINALTKLGYQYLYQMEGDSKHE